MKKPYLLLGALLLASCASKAPYPFGDSYNPKLGYDPIRHAIDDCLTIDGKLNEREYSFVNHLTLHKEMGAEIADLDITSYFGYEGIAFGIEVRENTAIWCNPNRATYLNSGIEMYLSKGDATSYTITTLEIDLVADGTLAIRRNIGGSSYAYCMPEDAIAPILSTTLREDGYTHELFIPYEFLTNMGFCSKNDDVSEINCDFVHIVSRNYEGTNPSVDRSYYCFGEHQLDDGSSWVNPSKTYRFKSDVGFYSHDLYIYKEGNGTIEELYGRNYAVPGNSLTLLITPEDGRASSIYSLKINDAEFATKVTPYLFGGYSLKLNPEQISEDLTIDVIFDC